jgi:membrane protein
MRVARTWAGTEIASIAPVIDHEIGSRVRRLRKMFDWGEDGPRDVPQTAPTWRRVALRIKGKVDQDNLSIVAAGVAFYLVLAVFPALAAAVSIYGLVFDPSQIDEQFASLAGILPAEARSVLVTELSRVASQPGSALSLGALAGLALAVWSARKGIDALIRSMNIIYESAEARNFVKRALLSLALTLLGVLAFVAAIAVAAVWPAVVNSLPLPDSFEYTVEAVRWPLLAGIVALTVAALYRFGPDRRGPSWRQVVLGAVIATLLWIVGSAALSFYVSNFGNYNKTYGSVGAMIVLLFWFYFSSFVILLGAELNAAMERARNTENPVHSGEMGSSKI